MSGKTVSPIRRRFDARRLSSGKSVGVFLRLPESCGSSVFEPHLVVWGGGESLIGDDFFDSFVDDSFMANPLYTIPYTVRKRNFFNRHQPPIRQHKLTLRDT